MILSSQKPWWCNAPATWANRNVPLGNLLQLESHYIEHNAPLHHQVTAHTRAQCAVNGSRARTTWRSTRRSTGRTWTRTSSVRSCVRSAGRGASTTAASAATSSSNTETSVSLRRHNEWNVGTIIEVNNYKHCSPMRVAVSRSFYGIVCRTRKHKRKIEPMSV